VDVLAPETEFMNETNCKESTEYCIKTIIIKEKAFCTITRT
jgi:hypothetical protein